VFAPSGRRPEVGVEFESFAEPSRNTAILRALPSSGVGKIELADTLNSDVYIQVRLVWERWVKFSVASNIDFYDSLIKEREEIAARRNKSEDELKALGN